MMIWTENLAKKASRIFLALIFIGLQAVALWPGKSEAIVGPGGFAAVLSGDAYQDVIEPNDMFVLASYQLKYPPVAYPTESIDQAYIARLYDPGGVNVANVQIYPDPYFKGYNMGVFGFYFTSAQVASIPLAFSANYTIRLQGNPTLIWTGAIPNYSLTPLTTHPSTDNASTQALIAQRIRDIAVQMQISWNVGVQLVSGAPLTLTDPDGVNYFSNAIPNLRLMTAGLYPTTLIVPSIIVRNISNNYGDSLVNRWKGVPVLDPILYTSMLGMSPTLWKAIFWFGVMIAIAVVVAKLLGENQKPVWFVTIGQMGVGTILGFLPISFTYTIAALAYIGIGFLVFWHD